MIFSSSVFLFLFLPVTILLYYVVLKKRFARNILLLIVSLFFYAWGEPKFVLIMCASIISNYFFAIIIDKFRESKVRPKLIIFLMLALNIAILFVFKYLGFAVDMLNSLTGVNIAVPQIALPIGISFFTFQAISYVIDVYRQNVPVQKNPLYVALYIAFFPQLIAGPIVRYKTIALQINEREETFRDFSIGCLRFVIGLSKKVLLANSVAVLADNAFSQPTSQLSVSLAWLGIIAYTLQIYFDFSGYSDMAIGLGRMFGFHFEENFNYPYISRSITEFWRRWHISLGTWFRDYVYFPLGGSRVSGNAKLVFNLFVVWLLTGFWHGASWNFVAWGLLYFIFIAAEKLISAKTSYGNIVRLTQQASPIGKCLLHIYTLIVVMVGWVLFRAPGQRDAWEYLLSMVGANGNAFTSSYSLLMFNEYLILIIISVVCCTPILWTVYRKIEAKNNLAKASLLVVILLLFMFSVSNIVKESYNPFIYFNF